MVAPSLLLESISNVFASINVFNTEIAKLYQSFLFFFKIEFQSRQRAAGTGIVSARAACQVLHNRAAQPSSQFAQGFAFYFAYGLARAVKRVGGFVNAFPFKVQGQDHVPLPRGELFHGFL